MTMRHITLNQATLRVVAILDEGGRIEARRIYPAPTRYWLMKSDGFRYATKLSIDMVSSLLQDGLIETIADLRTHPDHFDYLITDRGRDAAKYGAILYDDEQPSLLGDVA